MTQPIKFFAAFFLFSVLLSGGTRAEEKSAAKVIGKPIAIVNNEPIFMDELDREAEPFIERHKKMAPEKEQTKEKLDQLRQDVLDRLVEERLLLQEAKSKKVRVTKTQIDTGIQQFTEPFQMDEQGKPRSVLESEKLFKEQLAKEGMTEEQFKKRIEEQLMKVELIKIEVQSKVLPPKDEEVKKFFEKIRKKMAGQAVETANKDEDENLTQISKYLERLTGEQVRIRHILIRVAKTDSPAKIAESKKQIEDLSQKLKQGEDFAFLAKKFSDDSLSRTRGGEIGPIAKGDLGLSEVEDSAFKMKEGEVSGILQTDVGFHIVKLVEKKAPHPLEYDDIKEDLKNVVQQRVFTERLEKYLQALKEKASIKVNL